MPIYDPISLGINPPSGGFLTGGWYNGRQFWNGTLSEPGQIHPGSNQPGAGQPVSNEVVAATNPNNVGYIANEVARANANPVAPVANPMPTGQPTGQPTTAGTAGGATAGLMAPQASINLPELYKSLYSDSGIKESETQFSDMEKGFIEAKGKINDNPFLSEATRVGRVAKLETLFNERTANIKSTIATKKADIETQMNLQTKQFDINSQQARDALNQFNTLLGLGALDGASGEEIAAITRTTGISSSMIQSAINANKAKNVKTQTIPYDDGTNQGFAIINESTGEIINKQVISASKPKAETETKNVKSQFLEDAKSIQGQDVNGTWWGQFPQLVKTYAPYMTLEQIYALYLQSELGKLYGKPAEDPAAMKQLYNYVKTGVE